MGVDSRRAADTVVRPDVLVYPESNTAKVYRLIEGDYRKAGDFSAERHRFDLSKCAIDFDFARLWRRKDG